MLDSEAAPRSSPSIAFGVGWTYLGVTIVAVCSLVGLSLGVRELGLGGVGAFALAASVLGLVQTVDAGLSTSVVRAAARFAAGQRDAEIELTLGQQAYAALVLPVLAVGALLAVVVPWALHPQGVTREELLAMVALVAGASAVTLSTSVWQGFAIGSRRFRLTATASSTGAAAGLVVLVTTLPQLGVVALALAALVQVIVARGLLVGFLHKQARFLDILPLRPRLSALRAVGRGTAAVVLLTAATQVVTTSDLILLGFLAAPAAVGAYRVGSLLPTQAVSVLFQGFDVSLPALAAATPARASEVARAMSQVACLLAGLGFTTAVLLRDALAGLLVGAPDGEVAVVLAIVSVTWLANTLVHGIALMVVAQGRQHVLVPLVGAEVLANVVLTVPLVLAYGARGAAFATLVAVVVSNLLVLPVVARREAAQTRGLLVVGLGPMAVGIGVAVLGVAGARVLPVAQTNGLALVLVSGALVLLGGAVSAVVIFRGERGRLLVQALGGTAAPPPLPTP